MERYYEHEIEINIFGNDIKLSVVYEVNGCFTPETPDCEASYAEVDIIRIYRVHGVISKSVGYLFSPDELDAIKTMIHESEEL